MHMIKCIESTWLNFILISFIDEKNPKLTEIYKQKMAEYFERAEYLKKTVLTKQDEPVNTGSGSSQKEKKK